jgi:hypothetical protein
MNRQSPEKSERDDGRPDPEALLKRYRLRDSDVEAATTAASAASAKRDDGTQLRPGRLRV